jgi:hypothetical protein
MIGYIRLATNLRFFLEISANDLLLETAAELQNDQQQDRGFLHANNFCTIFSSIRLYFRRKKSFEEK